MRTPETEPAPRQKFLVLSHTALKMIAIVLMTLDHVAFFFFAPNSSIYYVFRALGRLAFPLFAFLAIEGVFKSREPFRYGLRVLLIGLAIDLVLFLFYQYGRKDSLADSYPGNSMTELGLGIFVFAFLEEKGWKKLIALPFAAVMVLSDFRSFFPFRTEYGTYGLLMMLGFYFSKYLADYYADLYGKRNGLGKEGMYLYNGRLVRNLLSSAWMLILSLLMLFFFHLYGQECFLFQNFAIPFALEQYSALAGIPIFFYSSKKGYTNRYLKMGAYVYYPLHMAVLALIYALTH